VASRVVVLDTNILVSAIRSRRGASYRLLSQVSTGAFEVAVSVPLVLEYEDAMLRRRGNLSTSDIQEIVDYVCSVARHQNIFYLWRPLLRDPKDDMVAEVAVASSASAIVTHNLRDFIGIEKFGIRAISPGAFLKQVGGSK
jgi:putative PIN family toxin of toxin-antitoxin system